MYRHRKGKDEVPIIAFPAAIWTRKEVEQLLRILLQEPGKPNEIAVAKILVKFRKSPVA